MTQKSRAIGMCNAILRNHLKIVLLNNSNFQLGLCNGEGTKNLKGVLGRALGELLLGIYVLPRSGGCFGRAGMGLVSRLSDRILGV